MKYDLRDTITVKAAYDSCAGWIQYTAQHSTQLAHNWGCK